MAVIEGAWAPNATDPNIRVQLVAIITVDQPAQGASTTRVHGVIRLQTMQWLDDSSATFTTSGSLIGVTSKAVSLRVSRGTPQVLHTFDKQVPLTNDWQGLTIGAAVSGISGLSSLVTLTGTVAVPPRTAAGAPPKPEGVHWSRRGDGHYVIYYTGLSTVPIPIDHVEIVREEYGKPTSVLGRPKWTARIDTSTTGGISDTSTAKEGRYRWGVTFVNNAGRSATVWTDVALTSPVAPKPVLTRSGSTVNGSWTRPASAVHWGRVEVATQYEDDQTHGAWQTLAVGASSHAFTPDPAKAGKKVRLHLRVRTISGGGTSDQESLWTVAISGWLLPAQKPAAPLLVGPVATVPVGTDAILA